MKKHTPDNHIVFGFHIPVNRMPTTPRHKDLVIVDNIATAICNHCGITHDNVTDNPVPQINHALRKIMVDSVMSHKDEMSSNLVKNSISNGTVSSDLEFHFYQDGCMGVTIPAITHDFQEDFNIIKDMSLIFDLTLDSLPDIDIKKILDSGDIEKNLFLHSHERNITFM